LVFSAASAISAANALRNAAYNNVVSTKTPELQISEGQFPSTVFISLMSSHKEAFQRDMLKRSHCNCPLPGGSTFTLSAMFSNVRQFYSFVHEIFHQKIRPIYAQILKALGVENSV